MRTTAIERLERAVPAERAAYLANLLTAAVFGLALVAVLLRMLTRGPVRGLQGPLP